MATKTKRYTRKVQLYLLTSNGSRKYILTLSASEAGLWKKILKAINQMDTGFQKLSKMHGGMVSWVKLTVGVLNGPQIRMFINDGDFLKTLNKLGREAMKCPTKHTVFHKEPCS